MRSRISRHDLRIDLPVTLYEAVLGGQVRVPTLDGAVSLTIPPGTNSGRVFRLRTDGQVDCLLHRKGSRGLRGACARRPRSIGSGPICWGVTSTRA